MHRSTDDVNIYAGLVEYRGIRFVVPITPVPNDTHLRNNDVTFKWGGVNGSLIGGNLTVEGRSYGKVLLGDTVKLSEDGAVTVNGEKREPR